MSFEQSYCLSELHIDFVVTKYKCNHTIYKLHDEDSYDKLYTIDELKVRLVFVCKVALRLTVLILLWLHLLGIIR